MQRFLLTVALCAALIAPASAVRAAGTDAEHAGQGAGNVRADIEAANAAFSAAFAKGDHRAVAELYSESARVIAPGSPIVKGREAIAAFWKKVIEGGTKDAKLSTEQVESAGDLAYEDGSVVLTGADGKTSGARYVVVWKRENGKWRLFRDIWNTE